jgi:DNA polymerase-3 subunit epsilon
MIGRMWAVDVEGNGGAPAEIVEIAIVEIQGLKLTGLNRRWRVRPPGGISLTVSRIHGIFDQDVEKAPEIEELASEIMEWIEDVPIVGHNVRVEIDIISRSLEGWRPPAAYDTLKLARSLIPHAEKYGLEALGRFLHLDRQAEEATKSAPHSALYDATLSAMLLQYMLEPLTESARQQALAKANLVSPEQGKLI